MEIKKILVCATKGSEELELATIMNIMKRANFSVKLAKVPSNETPEELNGIDLVINCTRGLKIVMNFFYLLKIADCFLEDESVIKSTWDAIILPGGKLGAENFGKSNNLIELLKNQRKLGKLFGAICASPALALFPHGLLDGEKATCYPVFKDILGDIYVEDKNVVVSNNLSKIFLF